MWPVRDIRTLYKGLHASHDRRSVILLLLREFVTFAACIRGSMEVVSGDLLFSFLLWPFRHILTLYKGHHTSHNRRSIFSSYCGQFVTFPPFLRGSIQAITGDRAILFLLWPVVTFSPCIRDSIHIVHCHLQVSQRANADRPQPLFEPVSTISTPPQLQILLPHQPFRRKTHPSIFSATLWSGRL